jgi:hypothetical protein
MRLNPSGGLSGLANELPGLERRYTPLSDRLHDVARQPLRRLVPDDDRFSSLFDAFEYLLALIWVDLCGRPLDPPARVRPPVGRFAWRYSDGDRRSQSH